VSRILIVADASSLINLEASQCFDSIVDDCNYRLGVVDPHVWQETLFVGRPAASGAVRDQIRLAVHESRGRVERIVMIPGELSVFVRFAASIDDGEAAALAVAVQRSLPILVDDLAVGRLIMAQALNVSVITTAGLMRMWARGQPPEGVAEAIRNIEFFGKFVPPVSDPDYSWWVGARKT
jgi:predicted nucleic acid-binding protein